MVFSLFFFFSVSCTRNKNTDSSHWAIRHVLIKNQPRAHSLFQDILDSTLSRVLYRSRNSLSKISVAQLIPGCTATAYLNAFRARIIIVAFAHRPFDERTLHWLLSFSLRACIYWSWNPHVGKVWTEEQSSFYFYRDLFILMEIAQIICPYR